MRKYNICVFGSAVDASKSVTKSAVLIGKELARFKCTIITGACAGLPYVAAVAAHNAGGKIIGFSPARGFGKQAETSPRNDNAMYHKLVYTPKNFPFSNNLNASRKYRNVLSTATCDAGIIISGRWGTLNEFTNLYDMGKVIGVLAGSGGVADELPKLLAKISKQSKAKVIFNKSPKKLVSLVINELKKQRR